MEAGIEDEGEDGVHAERFMSEQEREEQNRRKIYHDPTTGQSYNPSKRYGTIEKDNTLIYDNITTSYPVNLPPEYYNRAVQNSMPTEADGAWFMRPHHIESITQHPRSIKDDCLNTHYFSHYNQNYGKPEEKNECVEAISHLEQQLSILKQRQR